jgi:hypothetical protein
VRSRWTITLATPHRRSVATVSALGKPSIASISFVVSVGCVDERPLTILGKPSVDQSR